MVWARGCNVMLPIWFKLVLHFWNKNRDLILRYLPMLTRSTITLFLVKDIDTQISYVWAHSNRINIYSEYWCLGTHKLWFLRVVRHAYWSTEKLSNLNSDMRFKLRFVWYMLVMGLIFYFTKNKYSTDLRKEWFYEIPYLKLILYDWWTSDRMGVFE